MIASEFETANKVTKNRNSSKTAESGGFVLWQMNPDMWYVELALGGSKVHAGCNGKLVWRHTPWLGAHAAKGPVRPLRRALQVKLPVFSYSLFFHLNLFLVMHNHLHNYSKLYSCCRVLILEQQQACLQMQDVLVKRR